MSSPRSGSLTSWGCRDTHFRPVEANASKPSAAGGTESPRPSVTGPAGKMLRGVVHDPRSRALGGVAGHAGLFATADDVAIFAQTILNGGRGPNGRRVLSPLAVRAMIDAGSTPPGQRRGLGWDIQTSYSAPRGSLFGPSSFGHTGFTGTSLWIDPETETFVIILTSRLHPDGRAPSPTSLRAEVATLAAAAVIDVPLHAAPLASPSPGETSPSGGSTNPRGRASSGSVRHRRTRRGRLPTCSGNEARVGHQSDRPHPRRQVDDRRLVSRSRGRARPAVQSRARHSRRGRRGRERRCRPGDRAADQEPLRQGPQATSAEDLDGLDALVYDIQDVGARFYTYITTLGLVLEAAGASGKKVFVLDRPNPIGGRIVSGPVRDDEFSSFIAYHALPVRHGMTVGELALLYNAERKIGARRRGDPVPRLVARRSV